MSNIVFINLAIDQLLDQKQILKKIFSVRIPESERLVRVAEDLTLFASQKSDFVICNKEVPEFLQNAYTKRGFQSGTVREYKVNPFDWQDWIAGFADKNIICNKWLVCGMSQLERKIGDLGGEIIGLDGLSVDTFKKLNAKTWLPELAEKLQFVIPPSSVTNLSSFLVDLNNLSLPVKFPLLLKASWSSGGGGNLLIENSNSYLIHHLERLNHNFESDFQWLAQEVFSRKFDVSFVADTETNEFQIYEILYDEHGLSKVHTRGLSAREEKQMIIDEYQRLLPLLRQKIRESGYKGPFGGDGIVAEGGIFYPIVDLNVRWTKTHLIEMAFKKLSVPEGSILVRYRFLGNAISDVSQWLERFFNALGLDETGVGDEEAMNKGKKFFLPISVSGLMGSELQKLEITYFISPDLYWQEKVRQLIYETLHIR